MGNLKTRATYLQRAQNTHVLAKQRGWNTTSKHASLPPVAVPPSPAGIQVYGPSTLLTASPSLILQPGSDAVVPALPDVTVQLLQYGSALGPLPHHLAKRIANPENEPQQSPHDWSRHFNAAMGGGDPKPSCLPKLAKNYLVRGSSDSERSVLFSRT